MRNQMAMAPQILAQGQQRLQGVPAQFEPRFMERSVAEFCRKLTTIVVRKRATTRKRIEENAARGVRVKNLLLFSVLLDN